MISPVTTGRLLHVDAFATAPFAGNPAAVLVLDQEPDEEFGPRAGAELNQPATAIVWPAGAPGRFGLRWFTATRELALCGHGTLAAARVLLDGGAAVDGRIHFDTAAGPLEARAAGEWVELRFPRLPLEPLLDASAADASPADAADGEAVLGEAIQGLLDVPVTEMLRNDLDVLAVLGSPGDVRRARPDQVALGRLPVRGLIITAAGDDGPRPGPGPDGQRPGGPAADGQEPGGPAADGQEPGGGRPDGREPVPGADFVSRFFSPATGVGEDAVTGSAHCALGPYWIARLGRQPLLGRQLSARGGLVQVAEDGDRVLLSGPAVVLSEGTWRLPAAGHPAR
jgi:predicted PhzF superfamily epimerase YddE/YHI9